MSDKIQQRANEALNQILNSQHRKKLIVAGPGAGKTYTFKKLLAQAPGDRRTRLTLTFINELKQQLTDDLSSLSRVYTFHGYCRSLLHKSKTLRGGLSETFHYFPGLGSLIKKDWKIFYDKNPPKFIDAMRRCIEGSELDFYMSRSDYYDAVEFDDSVYRVFRQLKQANLPEKIDLILIDEYQDFNYLEASLLKILSKKTPIVIAGDDDQALYSQLRAGSPEFIRQLFNSPEYKNFELPYCMRCPEVIVDATNDIVKRAEKMGKLKGRLSKRFLYYPPLKKNESQLYPKIKVAQISAQSKNVNYFGRYVKMVIDKIDKDEIRESREKGFPTVLVIGAKHYLAQVAEFLKKGGHEVSIREKDDAIGSFEIADAYRILEKHRDSNLGWRVALEVEKPQFMNSVVRKTQDGSVALFDVIPEGYKQKLLENLDSWEEERKDEGENNGDTDLSSPVIKMTTFEGSKGLSAQRVFIIGCQEGDLPRVNKDVKDLEICKFLVALTRTRRECHILYTFRFAGRPKKSSVFVQWIKDDRRQSIKIDKTYWKKR